MEHQHQQPPHADAHYFCRQCTEVRLGPAAIEAAWCNVAAAQPLRPEQRDFLRALFASAAVGQRGAR